MRNFTPRSKVGSFKGQADTGEMRTGMLMRASDEFPGWVRVVPAALLGLASLWIACGSPAEVASGALMMDTDYPNAAAAFEIFVRSGWQWPLGSNPDFGGLNIFFSDAAPWYALLAKGVYHISGLFFSFHLLIIINFVLFSVMASRLAGMIFREEILVWLATALLAFNLIMPVRLLGAQHVALSSLWVVLWAMSAVSLDGREKFLRRWEFMAALGFAVWSHAYLGAMAVVIAAVALAVKRQWGAFVLSFVWPVFLLYILGCFHVSHAAAGGAKVYSLDLLAFVQSLNWGIIGNLYEVTPVQQGDAFVFLGTGASALAVVFLFAWFWTRIFGKKTLVIEHASRGKGRMKMLLAACLLLAAYGMAFNLRIAGNLLLSLDIPDILEPLYSRFRATGRFGMPLAFFIIISVSMGWGKLRRQVPLWGIIAVAAVGLQAADVFHAGNLRPSPKQLKAADKQREAVASLLKGREWSGRVFKDVEYHELEEQRLIDRLLVDRGAKSFRVVHGARLDPRDVKKRSGHEDASPGDIVILSGKRPGISCRDSVEIKGFMVCLR